MQAWQVYLEEFRQRVPAGSEQVIGRDERIREAAHDAYQRAADRMTREHGWADEHTLVVMRGLNAAVKQWLGRGAEDWRVLESELQRVETDLAAGFRTG